MWTRNDLPSRVAVGQCCCFPYASLFMACSAGRTHTGARVLTPLTHTRPFKWVQREMEELLSICNGEGKVGSRQFVSIMIVIVDIALYEKYSRCKISRAFMDSWYFYLFLISHNEKDNFSEDKKDPF